MRDVVDEGAERIFQHHLHRVVVHHIGVVDHHIQALPLQVVLRIAGAIEAELHRRGVERRAVMERHALAQMEDEFLGVLGGLVAFGELRLQLHVFVEHVEPLEHQPRRRLRQVVVQIGGIEPGQVASGTPTTRSLAACARPARTECSAAASSIRGKPCELTLNRSSRSVQPADRGGGRRNGPRPPAPAAPRWADRRADATGWAPRCRRARSNGRAGADRGSAPRRAAGAYRHAADRSNTAWRGPISTIWPRYITATRWLTRSTTAMSCEMNRYATPSSRLQVHQQVHHLRADRHVQRRHRLIGDDQAAAPSASARAMQMRWRWPPENSCG